MATRLRYLSKSMETDVMRKKTYTVVSFVHQSGAYPGNFTSNSAYKNLEDLKPNQIEK